MAAGSTHVFRVALQNAPAVYREVEIASDKSLADLAKAIVKAFDFDFDHAFGFYSTLTGRNVMRAQPKYELFADMGEADEAQSVKKTRVSAAFPDVGHRLLFLFDYGDEWRFTVEVIGRAKRSQLPATRRCLRRSVHHLSSMLASMMSRDADCRLGTL